MAETEVERLTRLVAEAEAQRHLVALGQAIVDVWRDGRRVTRKVSSLAELDAYIAGLRRDLEKATATAAGRPARRAIGLAWRN